MAASSERSAGGEPAKSNLHVLIMAGGTGTRFWPKSRSTRPKQLLALWDEKTLLQHTIDRFAPLVKHARVWIVTTESLVEFSRNALGGAYSEVRVLAEPEGKNTAPCILWGITEIAKVDPEATIAVMPADHYIGDEDAFLESVGTAVTEARERGGLVTLGIRPDRPETGYGYIETDGGHAPEHAPGHAPGHAPRGAPTKTSTTAQMGAILVKQFVEKPDLRTALRYIESGSYLWNAGMFIFTARAGLNAFEACMPELTAVFARNAPIDVKKTYAEIRPEDAVSIDYGVMESAASKGIRVAVVPASCGWNDVGSFTALEDINRSVQGEVVTHDCNSNVVQTDAGFVALLGVNDLVVVRDREVVLVAAKDRAQDVKKLLEKVRARFPSSV